MKKKILFLLFISFISATNNLEAANLNIDRTQTILNVSKIKKEKENEKDNEKDNDSEIENKYTKINLKNKKVLKKEIQKRKKYHKNLLSLYNTSFETKYINMISNNGIIISNLRKYYESNYII